MELTAIMRMILLILVKMMFRGWKDTDVMRFIGLDGQIAFQCSVQEQLNFLTLSFGGANKSLCIQLSMPATSAPSDRLWSLAARIVTMHRAWLDSNLNGGMMFLK
jgi:hypothetical protein